MDTFNKDMTINQILEINPDKIDTLLATGMHCIGCWVHGIDVEDVLEELNKEDDKKENK